MADQVIATTQTTGTAPETITTSAQPAQVPAQAPAPISIDYDKLSTMLSGTLEAKENTALKAYFKQQGMTEEEMTQAIATFKAEKAKKAPDPVALQEQLRTANATILQMQIEQAASLEASKLGIDPNTMPYVMKLADLSQVVGTDGKLIPEKITEAIQKVLTDLPALKPTAQGATGFTQVGAHNVQTGTSQEPGQAAAPTRGIAQTATKRWNRVNH